MQTVLNSSRFNLSLSPRINHQPFSSTAKIPGCEIPILPLSSSHTPISGVCRASGQVAELFPVTCPGIVVREAGIQDCWEVAETHCSSFFPGYSFPLDLLLRFDRVIGMLFGFSAPKGCKRTCLVAVIPSGGSFFSGSDDVGIGNFIVNKGYVAGVLTLDTVAKFLPRKGPLRNRRFFFFFLLAFPNIFFSSNIQKSWLIFRGESRNDYFQFRSTSFLFQFPKF
ncbi:hypothetical protein ACP275_06G174100 [Erythranthe tilingii]